MFVLAVASLVFPAVATAATDHSVDGTGTVKYRLTIVDGYTCSPDVPVQSSDMLCRERITGPFADSAGYISSGHYGGRLITDYSTADPTSGCVAVSGIVKFQTVSGFVRAKVAPGSTSCPSATTPGAWDQAFQLTVTSGSNAYVSVRGGTITWTALVAPSKKPGIRQGASAWTGVITAA
jgi:hypothetical protein